MWLQPPFFQIGTPQEGHGSVRIILRKLIKRDEKFALKSILEKKLLSRYKGSFQWCWQRVHSNSALQLMKPPSKFSMKPANLQFSFGHFRTSSLSTRNLSNSLSFRSSIISFKLLLGSPWVSASYLRIFCQSVSNIFAISRIRSNSSSTVNFRHLVILDLSDWGHFHCFFARLVESI